jgi:hypothetical protein
MQSSCKYYLILWMVILCTYVQAKDIVVAENKPFSYAPWNAGDVATIEHLALQREMDARTWRSSSGELIRSGSGSPVINGDGAALTSSGRVRWDGDPTSQSYFQWILKKD